MVPLPQGAGKLGLRGEFQQLGRSAGGAAERGTGRGSSYDVVVVPGSLRRRWHIGVAQPVLRSPVAITRLNR